MSNSGAKRLKVVEIVKFAVDVQNCVELEYV
jgi:hypothetical protein